MKIMRTLYAKIFGWFWLTLAVGALLVLAVTAFTGSQPLGRRWMRLTQDMYAHSAVDFYETGGVTALSRYLATLRESSGINASLLDEQQRNVTGFPVSPNISRVRDESLSTGVSTFHLGRYWTAATPVKFRERRFLFVIEVHPLKGFLDGSFFVPVLDRSLLALVVAAIFCLLLTRHIVAPVRVLQIASMRLASGDFATRVSPAIERRNDELGDTARAFDLMAARLQILMQRRQELLADISHELRSPLTRLSVSLELIRRGETDVVEQMETDLGRMNGMIGQILLLTRLDLQPIKPCLERLAIVSMASSIARDAEFEAQSEQKSVSVESESDCVILGDSNLLRSCIENVVRNAVHHTMPDTRVTIAIRKNAAGDVCEISIADEGPGVPESSLPLLFDSFYRVSESRDHDDGGTGLGLSISQRIAELHHGSIRAENRPDKRGLIVTLTFPSV